jgi:methyltransferase (TIGR00027 family)
MATLSSVSDTALLVAMQRARESERSDSVLSDPYARILAGERGERLARELAHGRAGRPVVARTVWFDAVVTHLATGTVACVVNLAAGLDSRPYRLDLPPALRWIEVDLADMLDYKASRMAGVAPRCELERVAADVTDATALAHVLDGTEDLPALVLTEGLLVYLREADVVDLSRTLAARANVRRWLLDVSGASAVRWTGRGRLGRQLANANAAHRWAPAGGPDFFRDQGWTPVEVRSSWAEARRLNRLPLWLRLVESVTPRDRRADLHDIARLALLERSRESPGSSQSGLE